MKLVIAEKPSQAKEYSNALNDNFIKKDGYFEGSEYFITWCFGHLIELERDTAYREGKKWDKSYLPLIPAKFQYSIGKDSAGKEDQGKKKQLQTIGNLMKKSSSVINGTDADREGELIFMYVYNYLNCKLPYSRLWLSSLTKDEILKAFSNLKTSEEFKNLGDSGYARAITDWLVGINATQSATLSFGGGTMLSIGRVQTTILKIICERYLKNKTHDKTYTYKLVANHKINNIEFHSDTEIYESENEAKEKLAKVKNEEHSFLKLDTQITKKNPPLLHSIDSLIVEANQKFNISAKDTLAIAQTLYEKKFTTYPRTDSQYINEEGYVKLKSFLSVVSNQILNLEFDFLDTLPKSINAKKITGSHDAIVPTGNINSFDALSENETKVYKLVLSKCLESFSVPAQYEKKQYNFVNNEILFTSKSNKLVKLGFLKYSFQGKNELDKNGLDFDLKANEIISSEIKIGKIESKPLPLFNDATLTPSLTKIGKFLKEENPKILEELKGKIDLSDIQIGTQATRPAIVEKLINIGFIEKVKNKFVPTEKGLKFYGAIKDLKVSRVTYTAILEKELQDIAKGILSTDKFYERLYSFIKLIVKDIFEIDSSKFNFNEKESFGICPKCKNGNVNLANSKKFYGCSEYKNGCEFTFNTSIAQKKLTDKNVKDLIKNSKTALIKGFTSAKKTKYDAFVVLDKDFKTGFEFLPRNNKK
ncbi:type IA DNA topoisomerase [Tenacibaculum finnmarkense]|uniref:type IA DNA topoisomerase n=1 Tax=Tenacibaculum finnmarkense TaxID=2781243 RepID=UPI001EFB2511|nr:type IA DNA topoisomerase [Tenacibaculum finnmarkense]MCG8226393.1 topoisomerase C-terminal repeat-containing protein [Tenacibaculum finnmarkense genomovar finnmarkense]